MGFGWIMDYWLGLIEYAGIAVGLMSGLLAIFREYFAIQHPERIPPKSLFWTCVRVAFIISAVVAWVGHPQTERGRTSIEPSARNSVHRAYHSSASPDHYRG